MTHTQALSEMSGISALNGITQSRHYRVNLLGQVVVGICKTHVTKNITMYKVRIPIAMQRDLRQRFSNDRGTARFLTPFFHPREYSHVIFASVIAAIRDLNRSWSTR
jgi:hypothetical protein